MPFYIEKGLGNLPGPFSYAYFIIMSEYFSNQVVLNRAKRSL